MRSPTEMDPCLCVYVSVCLLQTAKIEAQSKRLAAEEMAAQIEVMLARQEVERMEKQVKHTRRQVSLTRARSYYCQKVSFSLSLSTPFPPSPILSWILSGGLGVKGGGRMGLVRLSFCKTCLRMPSLDYLSDSTRSRIRASVLYARYNANGGGA